MTFACSACNLATHKDHQLDFPLRGVQEASEDLVRQLSAVSQSIEYLRHCQSHHNQIELEARAMFERVTNEINEYAEALVVLVRSRQATLHQLLADYLVAPQHVRVLQQADFQVILVSDHATPCWGCDTFLLSVQNTNLVAVVFHFDRKRWPFCKLVVSWQIN
jgi:hypothetical protein